MDLDYLLTPSQQARIFATGLLAILTLGTLSLILLCFIALWAVVQACTTIVLSLIATLDAVQNAYSGLNAPMQLVTLIIVASPLCFIVARRFGIGDWLKGV